MMAIHIDAWDSDKKIARAHAARIGDDSADLDVVSYLVGNGRQSGDKIVQLHSASRQNIHPKHTGAARKLMRTTPVGFETRDRSGRSAD
jgi:hypothetical protein